MKKKDVELKKAVIYARYSSHSQTEQSIEGQLRDAYAYAEREGFTIVREYIDRAQSGTKDTRTAFQSMIAAAPSHAFQYVLVWKLDRFARNRYDSAIYKARLKKDDIRIISVMERIEDNTEGIILEGMLESMAEYYSANLSENIRRGIRESKMKGLFTGGVIPFGYKKADGRMVLDEERAPIMQEVFRRYATGEGMKEIIRDLTVRGVKRSDGKALSYSTFMHALQNPIYIGMTKSQDEDYVCPYEPLIDAETFERVMIMATSRKRTATSPAKKETYILQGKVRCGYCGASLTGEYGTSGTGSKYFYYKCRNRRSGGDCKKKTEHKAALESAVMQETMSYILADGQKEAIADIVMQEYERSDTRTKARAYELQVSQLSSKIDTLLDSLSEAPKSVRPQIFAKIDALTAQKEDAEKELASQRIADGVIFSRESIVAWLDDFCSGDPESLDFQKKIIALLVNSVYVFDESIIVTYNIVKTGPPAPMEGSGVAGIGSKIAGGGCGSTEMQIAPPNSTSVEHGPFALPSGQVGLVIHKKESS